MQLSHSRPVASACFDDPNLVASAGLVPVMKLAGDAGLRRLADERLTVPTDKGANAGLKLASLVGGMVAGADSIDDMAVLRHGGMDRVFDACYAPSTLGSFLRKFTFGHVRQLDAVASRVLGNLAASTPLLDGIGNDVLVDVDDTIIEVHGHAKQGAGFGYSGVRGLNALLGTVTAAGQAPVIAAQRLRKGSTCSPRGAARLVADTLAAVTRLRQRADAGAGAPGRVLLRADSAFYNSAVVTTAVAAGAEVSVTVRLDKRVKAAIAAIGEDAWVTIQYTDAVFDEQAKRWISVAEVAETPTSRSRRRRSPSGSPAAWSCAGSRTWTRKPRRGRPACSRPGASTPSSPPLRPGPPTRRPRTRPTAGTRSSKTSTPT